MTSRSLTAIVFWLLALMLALPTAGRAQTRVALVIGNAKYVNTPALRNPDNDAEDVAKALSSIGFAVTLKLDATKRQFDQALAQFTRDAQGSEAALFYFAGHGMQFDGRNYVMPVDAELQDVISLRYEMVKVDDVKEALESSSGVKIMVLDSCRDNPLANKLLGSISSASRDAQVVQGLAPPEPTQGMVIVYATQSGQLALDGGAERNSPFAKAFVEELAVPGLEVAALFRNVENKVLSATGGRQSPELSISGVPEFFLSKAETDKQVWERIRDSGDAAAYQDFVKRFPQSIFAADATFRLRTAEAAAKRAAAAPAQPVAPPTPEAAANPSDPAESIFWQSAEKGGTIDDYLAYLRRYPNGTFAALAVNRLSELNAKTTAPATPAPTPSASRASPTVPRASPTPTAAVAPVIPRPAAPSTYAAKPSDRYVSNKPTARPTPKRPKETNADPSGEEETSTPSNHVAASARRDSRCEPGYHAVINNAWAHFDRPYGCAPD